MVLHLVKDTALLWWQTFFSHFFTQTDIKYISMTSFKIIVQQPSCCKKGQEARCNCGITGAEIAATDAHWFHFESQYLFSLDLCQKSIYFYNCIIVIMWGQTNIWRWGVTWTSPLNQHWLSNFYNQCYWTSRWLPTFQLLQKVLLLGNSKACPHFLFYLGEFINWKEIWINKYITKHLATVSRSPWKCPKGSWPQRLLMEGWCKVRVGHLN